MKWLILLLCFIPSLAFAEIQLNFKDKTTQCGNYHEVEGKYCKDMSGGTVCWSKSDIAAAAKVDEPIRFCSFWTPDIRSGRPFAICNARAMCGPC